MSDDDFFWSSVMDLVAATRRLGTPFIAVAAAVPLVTAAGCAVTEPDSTPLAVRASVGAPTSVDIYVTIPVRIENVGAVAAYVPQCYLVERLEGRRWIQDIGLSGACSSVPPEAVPVGAAVDRTVGMLRSRLPVADSSVLRVTYRVADDDTYEPARVMSVRTAPVTVR